MFNHVNGNNHSTVTTSRLSQSSVIHILFLTVNATAQNKMHKKLFRIAFLCIILYCCHWNTQKTHLTHTKVAKFKQHQYDACASVHTHAHRDNPNHNRLWPLIIARSPLRAVMSLGRSDKMRRRPMPLMNPHEAIPMRTLWAASSGSGSNLRTGTKSETRMRTHVQGNMLILWQNNTFLKATSSSSLYIY